MNHDCLSVILLKNVYMYRDIFVKLKGQCVYVKEIDIQCTCNFLFCFAAGCTDPRSLPLKVSFH